MARPDKHEMQRRRAREQIAGMLAKGRIAEAADACLALPADERSAFLPELGARSVALLSDRARPLDLSARLAWLTRIEREPRLLPEAPETARARWTLLQAALQAKQWPQMARTYEALKPALEGSPLCAPLEALITGRGVADPSLFLEVTRDDERLGYEGPARSSHPAPVRVEDVEHACLACFGLETWPHFRDAVTGWLGRKLPAEVARAVRLTAVALSRRELVKRASQPRSALEVAQFCAVLTSQCEAPLELEPVITLALRVAAHVMTGTVTEKAPIEATTKVVTAALAYPALAPLVERVVSAPQFGERTFHAGEQLLRTVALARPSMPLALAGANLTAYACGSGEPMPAPPWLTQCLVDALERAPEQVVAAFAQRFRERPPQAAVGPLMLVPVEACTRAIELLWDRLPEPRERELLADAGEHLLERLRTHSSSGSRRGAGVPVEEVRALLIDIGYPGAERLSDRDVKDVLRTMPRDVRAALDAMLAREDEDAPLRGEFLALWERLSDRLLPYRPSALEAALELAPDARARRTLIDKFLAHRPTLLARVVALHRCAEEERFAVVPLLEKHLEGGLGPLTQRDVSRALGYTFRERLPRRLSNRIARVLLALVSTDGAVADDPEVKAALANAQRLLRKRGKKAASNAKPAPRKRASRTKDTRAPRATSAPKQEKHDGV